MPLFMNFGPFRLDQVSGQRDIHVMALRQTP